MSLCFSQPAFLIVVHIHYKTRLSGLVASAGLSLKRCNLKCGQKLKHFRSFMVNYKSVPHFI